MVKNIFIATYILLVSITSVQGQSLIYLDLQDSILLKDRMYTASNTDQIAKELVNSFKTQKGSPTIISIAEATHGTEEIKNLQFKCAEQIVIEMGFRSITLAEHSFLESYKLLNYVLFQNIPVDSILKAQYYDINPLLSWLIDYNAPLDFDNKVWLIGADKNKPEEIIAVMESILDQNSLSSIASMESFQDIRNYAVSKKTDESVELLNIKIEEVESTLNANYSTLLNSPKNKVDLYFLRMALKNLAFEFKMKGKSDKEQYFSRDIVMFDNINFILAQKEPTVVIRGHNLHMNKTKLDYEFFGENKVLGELLNEAYATNYYSFGTVIEKGSFNYGKPNDILKIKESKKKIGNILGNITNQNFGFLPIDSTVKESLNKYNFLLTDGTGISQLLKVNNIGDAFNGLIFIKESSPYKYYKNSDVYSLFLNLSEKEALKILKADEIKIAFNYRFLAQNTDQKICINAYIHDSNKNILAKHYVCSTESDFVFSKIFEIPANAKILSLSLEGTSADNIVIDNFKINGKKYDKFTLYDWNTKGYKLEKVKNTLKITK